MDAKLVWTDAKPTVPGWYWWRIDATVTNPGGWEAVYVRRSSLLMMKSQRGQFAGPIPQPEEPRQ